MGRKRRGGRGEGKAKAAELKVADKRDEVGMKFGSKCRKARAEGANEEWRATGLYLEVEKREGE